MDPLNHQLMTELREDKVKLVSNYIPKQEVIGGDISDLLVISWGGTYGVLLTAIEKLIEEGKSVSLAHFKYIMPLPRNTKEVLSRYKRILVCEINMGQFVNYLRMQFPEFSYEQFNKVQGLPFMVVEITEKVNEILND